jgi:ribosomal protein S18 acetylase RimI-like enzyme
VRPIDPNDRPRLAEQLLDSWGSDLVVSRGRVHRPIEQPGFVAADDHAWLGSATYEIVAQEMEITTLASGVPNRGAGAALLAACVAVAHERGLQRVWLVTTNDNVRALRFYQRRGFVLVALRRGAIDEARRTLKPEIGLLGEDDIPIRDELELELPIAEWPAFVERYRWPQS